MTRAVSSACQQQSFSLRTDVWPPRVSYGLSPRVICRLFGAFLFPFQSLPELSPSPSSTLPPLLYLHQCPELNRYILVRSSPSLSSRSQVLSQPSRTMLSLRTALSQVYRSSSRIVALVSSPPQVHLQ
nr:hypothetical protein Iba_scaffold69653CG0010 [Ipomoea batatas]GME17746.1 hypothetical protein Iba_scaffold19412CG0010 [Ipomoea batatas]